MDTKTIIYDVWEKGEVVNCISKFGEGEDLVPTKQLVSQRRNYVMFELLELSSFIHTPP